MGGCFILLAISGLLWCPFNCMAAGGTVAFTEEAKQCTCGNPSCSEGQGPRGNRLPEESPSKPVQDDCCSCSCETGAVDTSARPVAESPDTALPVWDEVVVATVSILPVSRFAFQSDEASARSGRLLRLQIESFLL